MSTNGVTRADDLPAELRALRLEREAAGLEAQLRGAELRLSELLETEIPKAIQANGEASERVNAHMPALLEALAAEVDSNEPTSLNPSVSWRSFHPKESAVLGAHAQLEADVQVSTVALTKAQGERDQLNRVIPGLRGRADELRQQARQLRERQEAAIANYLTEEPQDDGSTLAKLRKRFGLSA